MNRDWLWDRKTSLTETKRIFKDPQHKNFISFSALLLLRKNDPREVFAEYIDPLLFCQNWPKIKKKMRQDQWGSKRIVFWQAMYEKLVEKYRKQGIRFRGKQKILPVDICKDVGQKIRQARKAEGLSQKALAERIGISQQLISRIEKGRENLSLVTLKKVVSSLRKKVDIAFV
jgi:DNA-binding XRE family transcriptional regulator